MADRSKTSQVLSAEINRLKERIRTLEAEKGQDISFFRSVVEDTSLLVCRFLPDSRISYVNKAFCDYFGKSADELIGTSVMTLIPEADREAVMSNITSLKAESPVGKHEHPVILPGGEIRWQRWFNRALFDDQGKIVGYRSIGEDVTDQRVTEMSLRDSEAFNRTLIDHLPQRIFLKDLNSTYLACNDNYARDLGIHAGDIVGRDDFAIFSDELAEKYRADDQAVMTGGDILELEEPYEVGGKTLWVQTTKIPYRNDRGEVAGILGIFSDITARKRVEQQLKAREKDLAEESQRLQEMNTTLKVLLQQREEDQKDMERRIVVNVRKRILPCMEQLSRTFTKTIQKEYAHIITSTLNDVVSPFLRTLTTAYMDLTPREIEVACLVHDGKTNKEIAYLLNLSVRSVECYRDGIRKKLGLTNKKVNLRTHLLSLDR